MTDKPQIFVVKTSPESILEDYEKLMHLANYQKFFPKVQKTIVKLNLSWSKFFPSCSSPPWQVEGVLKTMIEDGFVKAAQGLTSIEEVLRVIME